MPPSQIINTGVPANAAPELAPEPALVAGHFDGDAAMQRAIADLEHAGFDRAELSVPEPGAHAAAPVVDDDARQIRTLQAGTAATAGAMAAAGVAVATGGAAVVAVAAAAAVGLGAAGLSEAASHAVDAMRHERRENAAAHGTLVLTVRVRDEDARARARAILHAAGAAEVTEQPREPAAPRHV